MLGATSLLLSSLVLAVVASPAGLDTLVPRAADDNIVYVTDANKFW
jgi:hypothetical protein